MESTQNKLWFASDYTEGAHPELLKRLSDTNMVSCAGYGLDEYSESARSKIREACNAPDADVFFLVGGTQANACVIDAVLKSYQGVIAASTGHISTHEAGAIEYGGHKVIELPHVSGKISAENISSCIKSWREDENRDHMVMPGMVYISQPTEYGTLYSLAEMEEISQICRENKVALYVDGARLAYALACDFNDVSLSDLARLCDVFYIGGTKCGALLGEAVVFPQHDYVPHFFSIIKQHGALLAKGRVAGVQFDALFNNDLYGRIGRTAIEAADDIRSVLKENDFELAIDSPTNQIFVVLNDEQLEKLSSRVEMGFWEKLGEDRTVMRLATSWSTQPESVDALIEILRSI